MMIELSYNLDLTSLMIGYIIGVLFSIIVTFIIPTLLGWWK